MYPACGRILVSTFEELKNLKTTSYICSSYYCSFCFIMMLRDEIKSNKNWRYVLAIIFFNVIVDFQGFSRFLWVKLHKFAKKTMDTPISGAISWYVWVPLKMPLKRLCDELLREREVILIRLIEVIKFWQSASKVSY